MGRYARANRSQSKITASPEKYPQGFFNEKPCRCCGKSFKPKAPSHLYCGDKCNQRAHDSRRLEKAYGITIEQYEQMLKDHNGKCAICDDVGFELVKGQKILLVIDHDHENGAVRGLLCHNCNRGLGLFQDKIENLQSAVRYLGKCNDYRNHPAKEKEVE